MANILIIGATGSLGKALRNELYNSSHTVTLFSRSVSNLANLGAHEKIIEGSVMNPIDLSIALEGQDIIFASLSGDLTKMSENLVSSMKEMRIKRLIFISSMGIYNEIPVSVGSGGNLSNNSVLKVYRNSADVIEKSNLDYTVIRPGWFDNGSDDFEITHKGEPFGGHDVSRGAIAKLVHQIIENPNLYKNESIGINRPV